MHNVDAVFPRNAYDVLEKIEVHALRRRITREIEQQHLRARPGISDRIIQFVKKVDVRTYRNMADIRTCDYKAVGMNGVSRIRYQYGITTLNGGHGEVGQSLLRADRDDGLGFGIEFDAVALSIPGADSPP